jgi:hypothetical protein
MLLVALVRTPPSPSPSSPHGLPPWRGQARVRAAALMWERERDAADVLARQIAEAE